MYCSQFVSLGCSFLFPSLPSLRFLNFQVSPQNQNIMASSILPLFIIQAVQFGSQNVRHHSTCLSHTCQSSHLPMENIISHSRPLLPATHLCHIIHRPTLLELEPRFPSIQTDHRTCGDICYRYHSGYRSNLAISFPGTDQYQRRCHWPTLPIRFSETTSYPRDISTCSHKQLGACNST